MYELKLTNLYSPYTSSSWIVKLIGKYLLFWEDFSLQQEECLWMYSKENLQWGLMTQKSHLTFWMLSST